LSKAQKLDHFWYCRIRGEGKEEGMRGFQQSGILAESSPEGVESEGKKRKRTYSQLANNRRIP
jgi:hypothetical protein